MPWNKAVLVAEPDSTADMMVLTAGANITLTPGAGILTVAATGGSGGPPTGSILWWGTASAPSGYLLCDGAAVSRTTYADLFAVIGTTFGVGDGSTTFNVPNLKGRVAVGFDSGQAEFDALGETGGEKTHALTTAELAVHSHGVTDGGHTHTQDAHTHAVTDPGHTHLTQRYPTATGGSSGFTIDTSMSGTLADNTLPTKSAATGVTNQNATPTNQSAVTGLTVNAAGSGTAHNVLQPYLVLTGIIKT